MLIKTEINKSGIALIVFTRIFTYLEYILYYDYDLSLLCK